MEEKELTYEEIIASKAESKIGDELQFFKENYESPKQWAEETIRAHSYHEPIKEEFLKQLQECNTWEDVLRLSKEVVPFFKKVKKEYL